ncbi:hypothetical protein ACQZV8_07180 [Magnetococcales bacterium HHB-1]
MLHKIINEAAKESILEIAVLYKNHRLRQAKIVFSAEKKEFRLKQRSFYPPDRAAI